MKYSATIVGWGEEALSFLEVKDSKSFVILFNENAPEELAEYAILHTKAELGEDPAPGDTFVVCDKVYEITAVGEEAKQTFRELGHCTLYFSGDSEPERPGCIMVKGDPLKVSDVKKGGKIEIF